MKTAKASSIEKAALAWPVCAFVFAVEAAAAKAAPLVASMN
jgi:hypothetical protein